MIAIVDYDAGNVASVEKALIHLGESPVVTRDAQTISSADRIIVPGVGAFADAMARMENYGLIEVIRKYADSGRPVMGICLGLQLFFESSEEAPSDVSGLALLPGRIVRFPEKDGYKIPHMGWNTISVREDSKLFKNIPNHSYVYFVHSYYLQASKSEDVAATTDYIVEFDAAVESGNIYATQFHPEKSGEVGLQILNNFIEL